MSRYNTYTFREINQARNVNIGNKCLQDHFIYVMETEKWELKTLRFSEAFTKIIDEIITNASDAAIERPETNAIKIAFDGRNITVENNGPGFLIYFDDNLNIYSVELILTKEYTSSNHKNDDYSYTGGLNGIGAKIVNIFSKVLSIETANVLKEDLVLPTGVISKGKKVLYKQQFADNGALLTVCKPEITEYNGELFTKIIFEPYYDSLCRITDKIYSDGWIEQNRETVDKILRRRCAEVSVYSPARVTYVRTNRQNSNKGTPTQGNNSGTLVQDTNKGTPNQSNNSGTPNPTQGNKGTPVVDTFSRSIERFASEHSDIYISTDFGDLKVAICFFYPHVEKTQPITRGFQHVSIFNGLCFSQISNYVEALLKQLENFIRKHEELRVHYPTGISAEGKFPGKIFRQNITFISVFKCFRSKISMKGNEKTKGDLNDMALAEFKKQYVFPETFTRQIWHHQKIILSKLFVPKNKNKHLNSEKCIHAHRFPAEGLIIVEGDSAITLIKSLFEYSKLFSGVLSKEKYGIFSTGGVPPNPVKLTRFYNSGPYQTEKLQDNVLFRCLVTELGLDYNNPTKSRYKRVILATDQDHDGIGKICSLVINFLLIYFPQLVREGFIWRLRTPIIRLYKKETDCEKNTVNPVEEFYSEIEYEEYKKTHEIDKLFPIYYKGLGTHSEGEKKRIAQFYEKNLVRISYEEAAVKMMHILYNIDTGDRKKEIKRYAEMVAGGNHPKYQKELDVTITEHYLIESLAEQLNNIHRMTPDVVDGLKSCSRKALAIMRQTPGQLKVSALTGKALADMGYAHGEASMNGVCFMASCVVIGANIHPLFTGISGSIGSRADGKESAQARYTAIKYNPIMDIYFPVEDDSLLDYVRFEDKRYEPIRYVPIVPRIILEHHESVATGWNHMSIGRDFNRVMTYLRLSIKSHPYICFSELVGFPSQLSADMRLYIDEKGREICFGKVIEYRAQDTIVITELPLLMWTKTIIEKCKSPKKGEPETKFSKIVDKIRDDSGKFSVHMTIKLKPYSWEIIDKSHTKKHMSAVEQFFGLYTIFHRRFNFISAGRLVEYKSLKPIFYDWFENRRELYVMRLEKNMIRMCARLLVMENKLFFIENTFKLFKKKTEAEKIQILHDARVVWTTGEVTQYHRIKDSAIGTGIPCRAEEYTRMVYGSTPHLYYTEGEFQFITPKECAGWDESSDAGWDYILDIKVRDISTEKAAALRAKIAEQRDKIVNMPTWQEQWLIELDALEAAIAKQKKNLEE